MSNLPEPITFDVRTWSITSATYACPDTGKDHTATNTMRNLFTLAAGCNTVTCPNGRAMLTNEVKLVWYAPFESVAA